MKHLRFKFLGVTPVLHISFLQLCLEFPNQLAYSQYLSLLDELKEAVSFNYINGDVWHSKSVYKGEAFNEVVKSFFFFF